MIIGRNIKLRLMTMDDVELYVTLYNDLAHRGEFYPVNFLSVEKYKRNVAENNGWGPTLGSLMITTMDDRVIGKVAYFKTTHYLEGFEVGYNIFDPDDRGKGYGTEALKIFTAYLFEAHNIARLELNANPENIGSLRIAQKCGYSYEGRMRKATFVRGTLHDLDKYSILREECPSLSAVLADLHNQHSEQ